MQLTLRYLLSKVKDRNILQGMYTFTKNESHPTSTE